MDVDEVKRFAGLYDPQPFHTDEEAARSSFFGGLAASGWHTAAMSMRLLVDSLPIEGGFIGSGGELLWPKPVRPGDVLQVEAEVQAIAPSRSRPDRGVVQFRIVTRNQDGDTVQTFSPKIVVMRRKVGV